MASQWDFFSLLLLAFLLGNCFLEFGSNAQLIPEDEVKSLQIISKKLKNTYWKDLSQSSCNDKGQSFNNFFDARVALNNVTCNCSYNQGTVCHVTNIHLKYLNLTGVFPDEFGNLTELEDIDLSRNVVTGTIPKSISKLPLVTLSLSGNLISGPIPDEIGQIITLQNLILEDNQLGGTLPPSLGNLKNLRRMWVDSYY